MADLVQCLIERQPPDMRACYEEAWAEVQEEMRTGKLSNHAAVVLDALRATISPDARAGGEAKS